MTPITAADIYAARDILQPSAAAWALDNLDYLNKPMKLFGSSQKVEKGADKYDTYILYLQPADKVARQTLCPVAAAAGCKRPCLISSGQLGMSTGQRAATKRTILLLLRQDEFNAQLLKEIDAAERRAQRTGIPALFRLNGTSDISWLHIIAQRPGSMFYDYSKSLGHVRMAEGYDNYDVTYSGSMYSEQSRKSLGKAVSRGYRVAVAVNTAHAKGDSAALGAFYAAHTSFDKTDLRHLDAPGTIGVLSRKGSSKAQRATEGAASFFVTESNLSDFNNIIARAA